GAAGSSSCSFLNHARCFTRRRTGPTLGAFFFQAVAQRGLSACSGPISKRKRTALLETAILKWLCFLYPRASGPNATHVSSGGSTSTTYRRVWAGDPRGYYGAVIRVLQLLTATTLGGGPRQVFDLVRRLPADEFKVAVAGPRNQRFAADLRTLGIELGEVAVDT